MGGVETMELDKKELVKLVSYFVMGDGGIYKSSTHSYFSMNMLTKHTDYIQWCQSVISQITSCKTRDYIGGGCNNSELTNLISRQHPFFTKIRDRVYTGVYRGIDSHALKLLDPQSLAILYMSDGSFCKDKRTQAEWAGCKVTLNLKRLSYGDLFILKKALKELLNLEWNIHCQGKYRYLALRTKDVNAFFDMVKPFIVPSFSYKIPND